ncbi:Serine/threonine-protein phosphatase 7 long form-like protein [Bienertia sinuspersici]
MLQLGEGRQGAVQLDCYDVLDVFGLPCNIGSDVVETCRFRKPGSPDRVMVDRWREEFDVPESQQSAYLRQVLTRIESLVEGGEVFKRYFVVYCLGVFLNPKANGMIDVQVLRAVEDVDKISSFNWCQYVLYQLGKSVCRWKKNSNHAVGGCVFFLQIVYLHRMKFQGVVAPCCLPLVCNWDNESMKQRLDKEKIAGFGTSHIDDDTYPVSKKCVERKSNSSVLRSEFQVNVGVASGVSSDYVPTGVGVGSSSTGIDENVIKLLIPKGGLTDSQIQESGKNELSRELMTASRDLNAVTSTHIGQITSITQRMSQEEFGSQEDDVSFFQKIDEIVESILAFKAEISQAFVPPNATNNLQSNGGNNEDGAGLNQNSDVEKSSVLEKECEDNGFGCSIDCGPCDAFVLYLSIFMRENQQYFTKWPKLQKEICDYCLLDDEPFKRRVHRAEICSSLLLADVNQRRGRLLSSLADFNAKKSDLQDVVLARQQKKEEARRIEVEEKKRAINEKKGKVGVQKEKKKTIVADKKTRKM